MAPATPPQSSTDGIVDRLQSFVSENKKAVLIGASVAAVGVGYYVYSTRTQGASGSSRPRDKKSAGSDDATSKKKKSGSKGASKKSNLNDPNGPLLEEIKPKATVEAESTADAPLSPKLSPEEIAALSPEERQAKAQSYKTRGNSAYQKREYQRAEGLYTKAIEYASKPEAVFYSNRAACYMNLSPPEYEKAVLDCDQAMKLDKKYIKALNRRATALEALGRNEEALRDFTATSVLEKFQNEATMVTLERVVKKLAVEKTETTLSSREPRLPASNFVFAYLAAFRPKPRPTLPPEPSQGDLTLSTAFDALEASDYSQSWALVTDAVEQGLSTPELKAVGLNLRGTFKFLVGDTTGARDDLQSSLDILPTYTQTWVKIASVHMEMGDPVKAFEAFEQAIHHNENDPDIYYHRGQVYFIMQQFDSASEDYNKSTALDDTFVFSHIQYAVAQYKKGEVEAAKASFRKTMQLFPTSSEVLNYYGELLLDIQRFPDAIEKFEKAAELEKAKKPPINVLPIVNKALATFQWKNDIEVAQATCEEALAIDPDCDAAIATLAQLYSQTHQLEKAVDMFARQSQIARTSAELEQAFVFEYAARAQLEFSVNYPVEAKEFAAMAQAMRSMGAMGSMG